MAPGRLGPTQSGVSFLKTEARLSGWIPVSGATFRVTGEIGKAFLPQSDVLPLEDRYRLGGTGSMRGFRRDVIGPRREVNQVSIDWPGSLDPVLSESVRDTPTRWVPVGGDSRALGTVELVMPLPLLGMSGWDGYAASIFTDVGNVWLLRGAEDVQSTGGALADGWNPALRVATGVGLSIETPVGPLGLDLAANLQSLTATGARRTLLRDVLEEPPIRVHLSLGSLR